MSKKCPSCGAEVAEDEKFCPECGAKIDNPQNKCPSCGAEVAEDEKFCPECGAKIESQKNVCPSCGAEVAEDEKFCPECGACLKADNNAPTSVSATQSQLKSEVHPGNVVQSVPEVQSKKVVQSVPKEEVVSESTPVDMTSKNTASSKGIIIGAIVGLLVAGGAAFFALGGMDKISNKQQAKTTNTATSTQNKQVPANNVQSNNAKVNNAQANSSIPAINMAAISKTMQTSADKEGNYVHSAALTIDGNIASCWTEGVEGLGIGESVSYNFNGTYKVSGIEIWIGHQKSTELFYQNARPTAIKIQGSDGYSKIFNLKDEKNVQRIQFAKTINVNSITLTIENATPGSKYADTCIAEVKFF